MPDPHKTIVEVNGVKLEVDTRYARRIEELRIGDRVKILTKDYSSYSVHPGVIVGFEPFDNLPTIVAAYVKKGYSSADIEFVHYNAESKDVEIVVAADNELDFDREMINRQFDRDVAAKEREIEIIREKQKYFQENFQQYWNTVAMPATAETSEH